MVEVKVVVVMIVELVIKFLNCDLPLSNQEISLANNSGFCISFN